MRTLHYTSIVHDVEGLCYKVTALVFFAGLFGFHQLPDLAP